MAVPVARRTSPVGTDVSLLVLAGGRRWCAAIDLASGALVSARWEEPAAASLPPLVLAEAPLTAQPGDVDPVRPEQLTLAGPPRPVGRASRRRAERLLRPVLHPPGEHLLGFPGGAVPYWTLSGDRPSVAVVDPPAPPAVSGDRCRFRWRNVVHDLPLLPDALSARPHRPRRVVVTLSEPHRGQCYKVAAALL